MVVTFSKNPLDRFSCWIENSIIEPISRYYYKKKKAHYKCTVCGRIEAPYFTDEEYASITRDFGWHKIKGQYPRYVCHQCTDHGFRKITDPEDWEYTWDEWQDRVDNDNEKLLAKIKEKDPEYYEYWFNGGYERELFGWAEDE